MKKQVFDSLEEVFEAFGEDGVIPITYMPQIIFYFFSKKVLKGVIHNEHHL